MKIQFLFLQSVNAVTVMPCTATFETLVKKLTVPADTEEKGAAGALINQVKRPKLTDLQAVTMLKADVDGVSQVKFYQLIKRCFASGLDFIMASSASDFKDGMRKVHVLFPVLRPVGVDMAKEAFFQLMHRLGISRCEDFAIDVKASINPCQMLFNPVKCVYGEFFSLFRMTGNVFEVKDDLNIATYYQSSDNNTAKPMQKPVDASARRQYIDMYSHQGTIEKFNTMYSAEYVLDTWLADVYKKQSHKRYAYKSSNSQAGAVILSDGKFYSHHNNSDPLADNRSHSPFDLLCIHRFAGDKPRTLQWIKDNRLI